MSERLTPFSRKKKSVQENLQQPRISTELRRRPKQRFKDNDIHLATWNLRSLYALGALQKGLERLNLYWNVRCSILEQTHFFMEQNEQRFGTFVFILEHLHYIVENPMFNNGTK